LVHNHSVRFPLERRRESWSDATRRNPPYAPFTRREGDFALMRLQHWMELANAALADDRVNSEIPDHDPIADE
jgi:hypothetical protein